MIAFFQFPPTHFFQEISFIVGVKVSNEKMLAVAVEYLERMGFDNNPYFIFRHHDTSHPHCHILALRTRFDGTTVSDSNNYKRSEEIIRELEKQYGLEQVTNSTQSSFRAPDKDELEMIPRTGKASQKMVLQERVNTALSSSKNLKVFISNLEKADVHVLFNQASTGRVSGISFFMGDFKAKGQALGNQFKWGNIIKALDYEQIRDRQEISQANSRTRARSGEGGAGRSGGARPDGRGVENHTGQPASTEQDATFAGKRGEQEAYSTGRFGEVDEGHGKYSDEFGEAAAENEEAVDGHLLHGDRSAPGFPHSPIGKDVGLDIVPDDEDIRRRRKSRSRLGEIF
jgi:hypothetical protein